MKITDIIDERRAPDTTSITIRSVPEGLKAWLQSYCDANGLTMSAVLIACMVRLQREEGF